MRCIILIKHTVFVCFFCLIFFYRSLFRSLWEGWECTRQRCRQWRIRGSVDTSTISVGCQAGCSLHWSVAGTGPDWRSRQRSPGRRSVPAQAQRAQGNSAGSPERRKLPGQASVGGGWPLCQVLQIHIQKLIFLLENVFVWFLNDDSH